MMLTSIIPLLCNSAIRYCNAEGFVFTPMTLHFRLSLNIMTLSITTNRGCYTKLGVDIEVTGVAQV